MYTCETNSNSGLKVERLVEMGHLHDYQDEDGREVVGEDDPEEPSTQGDLDLHHVRSVGDLLGENLCSLDKVDGQVNWAEVVQVS